MSITRGEISGRILRLVNKTSAYPGFYTPEKIADAIEDGLDYIAVDMFLAGEGWQDKIKFFTVQAGTITVPITSDIAMIRELRYKVGGSYVPMSYDTNSRKTDIDPNAGAPGGYAGSYRIVDNQIYFSQPLAEGGANYLQLEYTTFPKRLTSDHEVIDGHLFKPFVHWLVFWCSSRLVSGLGKPDPDWMSQEASWYKKVVAVIYKRNMQTTTMREFDG